MLPLGEPTKADADAEWAAALIAASAASLARFLTEREQPQPDGSTPPK